MLLLAGCASKPEAAPLVTVSQPAPPPVSTEEGELFRCAAPPVLADGATAYEDLEELALKLRDAYDTCRDMDSRLIDLATKPAGAVASGK